MVSRRDSVCSIPLMVRWVKLWLGELKWFDTGSSFFVLCDDLCLVSL